MVIPRKLFNEKFYPLLNCDKRYMVLYGSRGSSKSEFVAQYCVLKAMCSHYFKLIYCRKSEGHIRESQFSLLKKWISNFGLQSFFRIYEGTMRIDCLVTGNKMVPKGVDNPERVKSLDEPSHVWFEEITEFNQEDFETVNNSIRTDKVKPQAICTFNPISENNWVRNFFFHPTINTEPNPLFEDDILIHHSTFWDNRFIDREAYHKTLLISSAGNENKYNVNAKGLWGIEDKDGKFAWAFESAKHVKPTEADTDNVFWATFDFNINPMTCTVAQVFPETNTVRCLECIKLDNSNTWAMCDRLLAAYPDVTWLVTGDATGQSSNAMVEDSMNNYKIIIRKLQIDDRQVRVPPKNPRIEENQLLVNAVLKNWNVEIDPERCQPLIYDLTYVAMNGKGEIIKDRSSPDKYADFLDGFRYLCNIAIKPHLDWSGNE